jgi:hypothetical protein
LVNEVKKADVITNLMRQEKNYDVAIANYDKKIQEASKLKQIAVNANDRASIKQHHQHRKNLLAQKPQAITQRNEIRAEIKHNKANIQFMNQQNAHVLVGDKINQVSVDVNPRTDNRGMNRAVFDYNINDDKKCGEFRFAGYTSEHKYSDIPNNGQSNYHEFYAQHDNNLRQIHENINSMICNQIIDDEEKKD